MLTWGDVIKLCVPFIFALILMWVKEWYVDKRERDRKQAFLWRTINQNINGVPAALDELDKISDALKSTRMRFGEFAMPGINRTCALRLAELDYKNAHIYADYAAASELADKGFESLKTLLSTLITASQTDRENLLRGFNAQKASIKRDLLDHARLELSILKVIKARNRRNKTFDNQAITMYSNMLHNAEQQGALVRPPT